MPGQAMSGVRLGPGEAPGYAQVRRQTRFRSGAGLGLRLASDCSRVWFQGRVRPDAGLGSGPALGRLGSGPAPG